MIKKIITIITAIMLLTSFGVTTAFADGIGCGEGFGPIAQIFCGMSKGSNDANAAATGGQLNKIISVIVGVMTAAAAIWFIFQFIIAGYQWIQSGGDKNNVAQARDKITNSLIGLIIVVSAWIVIGVLGKILGLNILNPGEILLNLGK